MGKSGYLLIAVVIVILVVMFGHNPTDWLREKTGKRKTERLIERIMVNANVEKKDGTIKEKTKRTVGMRIGSDTSADKDSTSPLDENSHRFGTKSFLKATNVPNRFARHGSTPDPASASDPASTDTPAVQQAAPQPKQSDDNYYPPLVGDYAKPGLQQH